MDYSQALTAMGRQWHVDHFVCVSCETSLAHVTFFEHDGQPYCEKDHQELFSPKCAYCNGSILDVSVMSWLVPVVYLFVCLFSKL